MSVSKKIIEDGVKHLEFEVKHLEAKVEHGMAEFRFFKSTLKTVLVCIILPFCFLMLGGYVFRYFEYDLEKERWENYNRTQAELQQTILYIHHELNHSTVLETFESFIEEITPYLESKASVPDLSMPFWDLKGSSYFSWTIMTTIGYGTYAPYSNSGKAFCIVYTFLTVPLFVVSLAVLSDILGKSLLAFLSKYGKHTVFAEKRILFIWLTGIFFLIILSAAYSNEMPDWSYLDSVYFSIITLSTVGLGDYTPKLQAKEVILFILYCMLGMLAVGAMLSSLQDMFDYRSDRIAETIDQLSEVIPSPKPNRQKMVAGWEHTNIKEMFPDTEESTDP